MEPKPKRLITPNGIDAETGTYITPPMTAEGIYAQLMGDDLRGDVHGNELALKVLRNQQEGHFGAPAGVDAANLAMTGWGVIFASNADPALREALAELLNWRQKQAGKYYKEFAGKDGFQVDRVPEDSYTTFLARAGIMFGSPVISKVPYYLLLVGDPTVIPYRFQQLIDTQYAVGRIAFDTLEEYAQYARSVVQHEKRSARRQRQIVLAGTQHPNDSSTEASATILLPGICEALNNSPSQVADNWTIEHWTPERTCKADLLHLLGSPATPALSFIACHGLSLRGDRQRQRLEQGALLGQDWPGREVWGEQPIDPAHYVTANDVTDAAQLSGSITFLFACFSAGTPKYDEYAHSKQLGWRETIAPQPMVSKLPQRLLSHPNGGALAVIGHVDQLWSQSFTSEHGTNAQTFAEVLIWLMNGARVGYALEPLSMRLADISGVLNEELENKVFGKRLDPEVMVDLWTTHNDARGYILLGDPAVRLTFDE